MTSLKQLYDLTPKMEYYELGKILNALIRCKGTIVRSEVTEYFSPNPRESKAWIRVKVSNNMRARFENITGLKLTKAV